MSTQRDWRRGGAGEPAASATSPALLPEQLLNQRPPQGLLDPSLKTIFDDLVEGILVVDIAGHRMYSNPALNELVGGNACHPLGTPDPPSYVPLDQRQRYFLALKGTSSLLTMEGSGAASTWLELMTAGRARVRHTRDHQFVYRSSRLAFRRLAPKPRVGPGGGAADDWWTGRICWWLAGA